MDFSSDTSAPAHPAVIESLARANAGMEGSYGADRVTEALKDRVIELFDTEQVSIWPCASGTAANALALSVLCSPTGAILCHQEAHIERDERGAPEFFTGGGKLRLLPGADGQIDEAALRIALADLQPDFVHETPAEVLSLTNLTECGTAYEPERLKHFAALAKASGLHVHLDGARFANAIADKDLPAAELSWRAGVDVLTLGLTKTGAMGCELVLLFGDTQERFGDLTAKAKRSGHMPPKLRFLAAQGLSLLDDNLWLQLAQHANRAARLLSDYLCQVDGAELVYPVDGNEVFVRLPDQIVKRCQEAGVKFYPWPGDCYRFVCNWTTDDAEIDALAVLLRDQS